MESAISVRRVSFSYPNGLEALRDFSIDVAAGKVIGIVGPSGCGKSTLLSLIAGHNRPTAGEISCNRLDGKRHPLTMVFQKDTLLPWLTAEENVKLYFRFHGGDRKLIAERVSSLLRMAGLEGFEKAYPYQLSGGMRRRVAFLSAVAPSPERLLLDEPFSSLDEPTRVMIHQDVQKIIRRFQMTTLLVTHDIGEAITMCDEVIVLTKRPARIASRHMVPFGTERNVLELRQTPEFLELYGELWSELSRQIASGGIRPALEAGSPDGGGTSGREVPEA